MISITEIQDILAHRYPFLLVDRITELEPMKRAVGIKNVNINESFFRGHFPGNPIMPGALILEAISQVGGVAMLYPANNRGTLAYTVAINRTKFRHPVTPGDQLRLVAEVIQARSKMVKIWGEAFVDDRKVVDGELMFHFDSNIK
ncbi:MAG: (3R)-hydroxymyristoyl-(acyl-carrier-protein) dehydratase [Firmicutes bacterium]|nr:(3R)-hydroxymyristoyl-(acyl-carrier-protein) dehydratase [Bacillota bacterium]